jgi:acyl dehydratase
MPLNKDVIGEKYPTDPFEIIAHESIYYALAYNEDNDAYFDNRRDGGIIAPPMYAVRYAGTPVGALLFDQETGMNIAMMVHYKQEFEWIEAVRPGDVISNDAEITHIEETANGSILGFRVISRNQNNEEVVRSSFEFFDRSATVEGAGRPKREKTETGEILWSQEMRVRNGQTFIYAEPSGDHNLIHVDNDFATKVGLPGIILQGLCTMAFAHKAAVDNLCGLDRNPLKLKKMGVQFARPVIPGQTLTFKGFAIGDVDGGRKFGIIAKNDLGKDVLRDAWCLIG